MANSFAATRTQLIFALCLPLAVLLGYFLADPLDPSSMLMVAMVIGVLSIPVLMRWYHPLLIVTWNAAIAPYILPGQPFLWSILALVGLGFAVVNRFTSPEARIASVPSINRALLLLLVVTLLTLWARGGLGVRSLGSGRYGGKSYFYILASIAGYFALVSQRIPRERATLFLSLFFLSGLTGLVPNLAYMGGPKFEFLFYAFPSLYALEQVTADYSLVNVQVSRIFGLTAASIALTGWLLAHYGLRRIFDWRRPLPLVILMVAFAGCAFCGFRSILILFVMMVGMQFCMEGLYRGRAIMVVLASILVAAAILLPNAERLPLVVQRTISFLPIKVDAGIRLSAQGSSEWRFSMWSELLQEVPKYLFLGKGYAIDPTDLQFSFMNSRRGYERNFDWAMISGDYHSGPLSLIIPLGLGGVIAFVWLVLAGLKYLYWNYRHGDPALRAINRFLLGYFIVRVIFFTAIFGGFYSDLFVFTGLLGLSVSLNGEKLPEPVPEPVEETEQPVYHEEFAAS